MPMIVRLFDRRKRAEPEFLEPQRPICSGCGKSTRFVAIVDQPIHGHPDQRIVQFACSDCRELVEEVVTLPSGYDPSDS